VKMPPSIPSVDRSRREFHSRKGHRNRTRKVLQSYPYIVNLPTSLRIEFPGAIYHLTSRRSARQKIYQDHADPETFLISLSHVVDRYA